MEANYIDHNTHCDKAKWNLDEIKNAALDQDEKQISGIAFRSIGITSEPVMKVIPVHCTLPPIFYLLLGLGNDQT